MKVCVLSSHIQEYEDMSKKLAPPILNEEFIECIEQVKIFESNFRKLTPMEQDIICYIANNYTLLRSEQQPTPENYFKLW